VQFIYRKDLAPLAAKAVQAHPNDPRAALRALERLVDETWWGSVQAVQELGSARAERGRCEARPRLSLA